MSTDLTTLAGKYQIVRRLASGGMAEVFLARQLGLDGFQKLVVIKRIHPHLAENDEFVRMMLSEARVSADLRHPNVVNVLEINQDQGVFFLVMEYLHGQDVARVMNRAHRKGEPIPLSHALRMIIDAGMGLAYAHTKTDMGGAPLGIIHRDISPQNILVTYEGVAKVVDFGIAKARGQAMETASGILKGKVSYMSPEQASGELIDHRTDQFALGIILYEITTGQRLFKRDSEIMTMHAVVECEVPRPGSHKDDYPRDLEDIVMTALAKRREDRFPSCAELVTALEDFMTRERIPHSPARLGTYMKALFKEAIEQDAQLLQQSAPAPQNLTETTEDLVQRRRTASTRVERPGDIASIPLPISSGNSGVFRNASQSNISALSRQSRTNAFGDPLPSPDEPTTDDDPSGVFSALTQISDSGLVQVERRTNLPGDVPGFVGRLADVEALGKLFANGSRLVTLLGPGGTGKTRLSQHFGVTYTHEFMRTGSGGVWFCDLTESHSADDVCSAVGQALNIPLTLGKNSEDNVKQLGHALNSRGPTLLIMDNFEQVVEHASATVGQWLTLAAETRFLITSRELLRIGGETPLELPPLSVPQAGDEARDSEAVQLFVARARLVRPNYVLTDEDAPVIAEIVRQLDGLPLAIELAAARMGVMGAAKLLERLPRRFDLLTGGGRTSARQRTLRGAIDWSWNLMQPFEQEAMAQCSVFRGSFDLDAAEAVVDLSHIPDAPWTFDVIQALREKSLLRPIEPPGSADVRFGMYESIREYAAEKLVKSGQRDAVSSRHAAHYLKLGSAYAVEVEGAEGGLVRQKLALEMENLLAVFQRSLSMPSPTTESATRALTALLAMDPILSTRGPFGSYLAQLDAALTMARKQNVEPSVVASVLKSRGWALLVQGRQPEALKDYEEALALARSVDNKRVMGRVLGELGVMRRQKGQLEDARACYEEALEYCRAANDDRTEALTLGNMGNLHRQQGRFAEAQTHYELALEILQRVGDGRTEAIQHGNLGLLEQEMGHFASATEHFERAVALAKAGEDRRSEAVALGFLGGLFMEQGLHEEARSRLKKSVSMLRQVGDRRFEGLFLSFFGGVEALLGKSDESRNAFDSAQRILREAGDNHGLAVLAIYEGLRDVLKAEEARTRGNELEARKLSDGARKRLEGPRSGTPSLAQQSDIVRTALRILEGALTPE